MKADGRLMQKGPWGLQSSDSCLTLRVAARTVVRSLNKSGPSWFPRLLGTSVWKAGLRPLQQVRERDEVTLRLCSSDTGFSFDSGKQTKSFGMWMDVKVVDPKPDPHGASARRRIANPTGGWVSSALRHANNRVINHY